MAPKKPKSDRSSRVSRGKPSDQSEMSVASGAGKKGRRGSKKGSKDDDDGTEGFTTMTSQVSRPDKGRKRSKSLADVTDTPKVGTQKDRRKSQSATDVTEHMAEKNKKARKGAHDLSEIKKGADKKSKGEVKSESHADAKSKTGSKATAKKQDTKKKTKASASDISNVTCSCRDCSCRCCEELRAGVKQRSSREPSQTRVETIVRIEKYDSGPGVANIASEPVLRRRGSGSVKPQGGDASEANITVRTRQSSSHTAAGNDSDVVINIRVVFRDSHGSERSLTSVVRTPALPEPEPVPPPAPEPPEETVTKVASKESLKRRKSSSKDKLPMLPEPPKQEALETEQVKTTGVIEQQDVPALDHVKISYSVQGSTMDRDVTLFADVHGRGGGSFSMPPEIRGAGSAECQAIAELEALSVHVVKKVHRLREIHMDNKAMRAAAQREI